MGEHGVDLPIALVTLMPECDAECGDCIRRYYADAGIDCHVTHVPPLVLSSYEPLDMRCPHGVLWFAEPTSEQRAVWARDGVA